MWNGGYLPLTGLLLASSRAAGQSGESVERGRRAMPVRIKNLCYPTLGLLLWLAIQAGAHVGDRLYPIA